MVITQYTAVVNPKKMGYTLSAFISLKFHSGKLLNFQKKIDNFPEIIDCHRITGNNCLMMKLHLRDSSHLEEVIDRFMLYGEPSTSIILSEWGV